MLHQTFVHDDPVTVNLAEGVQADLMTLAGRLDAHLLPVGEALLGLVESVDTVVNGLADVAAALSDGAAERAILDVLRASTALIEAPARQAEQRTQFAVLRERVATLSKLSHDLDRVLMMLEFYCINMKIAASGAEDFGEFADEMRTQLIVGRQHLADFGEAASRLFTGFDDSAAVDSKFAAECSRLIPAVPNALADAAQRLREQQSKVMAAVGAGQQIASRVRAKVGEALGAIQIADNVRQRIEHVAYICEQMAEAALLPTAEQRLAAEGHLAALAIAQLEAIGADFAQDAGQLLTSLEALLPDARHLLDSIRTDTSINQTAALVGQFGADIATSAQITVHLQQANEQATEIVGSVLTTIEALSDRVERVRDLGLEVGYMSVNANLRSRRDVTISKAVSVIATEIKVQSTIIDNLCASFVEVANEMGYVATVIEGEGQGSRLNVQRLLGDAHGAISQSTTQSQEGVARIGQDCSVITGDLPDTIERVRESLVMACQLETVSLMLSPVACPASADLLSTVDHPLVALLERVAGVYTMQSERKVHAQYGVMGCSDTLVETAHAAGTAGDDDDDDVLF